MRSTQEALLQRLQRRCDLEATAMVTTPATRRSPLQRLPPRVATFSAIAPAPIRVEEEQPPPPS